jgi:hypothetical protein
VERIRVFVGTPANNEDLECQAVLAWSLKKHHPADDVDLTWMMLSRDPQSFWYSNPQANPRQGWNTKTWATPFSPLRWGIPAACNYEGKAIYCDSDQIFMADVAELWNQPLNGKVALMSKDGASCCFLMDCAAMRGILPRIEDLKSDPQVYRHVRGKIAQHSGVFTGDWNCRDGVCRDPINPHDYDTIYNPDVKLLHYTRIPTQPNHKYARERLKKEGKPHWFPGPDEPHPKKEVTELFDRMYAECVEANQGPETFRTSPEFGAYGR